MNKKKKKLTYKKNINNRKIKQCSKDPMTGYYRDGYCMTGPDDLGTHTVCSKMNPDFLKYTESKGNDLSSVVKPGQNWCLCENRWLQAYKDNKAPLVIENATNMRTDDTIIKLIKKNNKKRTKKISKGEINLLYKKYGRKMVMDDTDSELGEGYDIIYRNREKQKGGKRKKTKRRSKKEFLFNPNNPNKSFDVYIDKNPKDTIPIKYTSLDDVKKTIRKLERLYKKGEYTHKRIWQVGMILYVRLKVLKDKKPKEFKLSERYFKHLGKRSKIKNKDKKKEFQLRKKLIFKI